MVQDCNLSDFIVYQMCSRYIYYEYDTCISYIYICNMLNLESGLENGCDDSDTGVSQFVHGLDCIVYVKMMHIVRVRSLHHGMYMYVLRRATDLNHTLGRWTLRRRLRTVKGMISPWMLTGFQSSMPMRSS